MSKEKFEEVERPQSTFWKPAKEGETIEGEVVEILEGKYGKYLNIKQANGVTIGTPSHAILQSYIPTLQIGDKVRIELSGTVRTKNGIANDYKVYKVKK